MAFSIKKRDKSKSKVGSISDDDGNATGETLHRSSKTSKSKKEKRKSSTIRHADRTDVPNEEQRLTIRSSSANRLLAFRHTCPCDTHYDKQLLEHDYELTVDKLFDSMFGKNDFVRQYREAQNIYDDTATNWSANEETKHRERTLNYKLPYESSFVGKGTISTREKQTLTHEVVGSHYVLESEVFNEGVKFSDTFYLCMRYCLVQTSATTTHCRITARVRFCKSVNGFMKQLIERNAYASSTEGLKDLHNRLSLMTEFGLDKTRRPAACGHTCLFAGNRGLNRNDMSLSVPLLAHEHSRRMSRHDALSVTPLHRTISCEHDKTRRSHARPSQSQTTTFIFTVITVILVLVHMYLYFKLRHMDILVDNLSHLLKLSSSRP